MTDSNIEARLARLEARAEIDELLVRYALHIDDHEFEALGSLFTDDAAFGSPSRMHSGRADIVANYRKAGALYPLSLHEVRGLVLEFVDDDHARGRVIGYSEQANDEHTVVTSIRYDDEYTRVDGRWLFAARRVSTLYAMSHAELADHGLRRPLRKRWPHRDPAPAELPIHITDAPV